MEQYQPVDGDPFAASAVSLQPVQGDPFATGSVNPQTTPQGSMPYDLQGQSIAAYNPTWREKAAQWLYGDQPRSPEAQATIRGLTGTTGLGTPQMSVADLTPVGGAFASQEAARRGDYSGAGIAAMSALPGAGVIDRGITEGVGAIERGAGEAVLGSGPIRQATEKLEPVTGDPFTPITAYHGSPHDFDAFDMSKIGTGEGAQAYGHGLYFAGNENVARYYEDAGRPSYQGNDRIKAAQDLLQQTGGDHAAALNLAQARMEGTTKYSEGKLWQDVIKNWDYVSAQSPGKMYQVQINANPNHFLDWDKPLSEQHPVVQQALGSDPNETVAAKLGRAYKNEMFAGDIIGKDRATPDELTAGLAKAGIPGIKYLDAGSRGAGEGTSNYVVFDDKIINILKKYGIGGLGIGTAAGLSHFKTQPVNGDPYSNQPD